jgi:hypothetical protein
VDVASAYAFASDIRKHLYTDVTEGKGTSYVKTISPAYSYILHTVNNVRSPSLTSPPLSPVLVI